MTNLLICELYLYHPSLSLSFMMNCDELNIWYYVPNIDTLHTFFDLRHASYTDIYNLLTSFNWAATFHRLDIDSATSAFYDALHFCILKFVSIISYTSSKFPIWFSKTLKTLVFDRKRAHFKYKLTRNITDYSKKISLSAFQVWI